MASRRNLKKKITNIASDLFLVSLNEDLNKEIKVVADELAKATKA